MKHRCALATLILLLAGIGGAWAQSGLTASRHTLLQGGAERHYELRVPRGQPPAGGWPLVLVLHGGGGHAGHAESMTGFSTLAEREGFMVAYPQGSGRLGQRLLTWNAGHCCGFAMTRRIDDVGFLDALVGQLLARHPVDPHRVYLTGLSNGGMMTHRAALALPHRFAAIAPVIAPVFGDEPRAALPVPALMVNGALDTSVPPQGGQPHGRFPDAWDGTPLRPALDQARHWAASNGCGAEARHEVHAEYQRWAYACPPGATVELLLVGDNGHAWPGGRKGSPQADSPNPRFDASQAIWSFFRTQARGR